MRNRHFGEQEVGRLLAQLQMYKAGSPPFNKSSGGKGFNVRLWWATLPPNMHTDMIAKLAVLLIDIVPHSAGPERTFSITGWYHSKLRNRMRVSTNGKLAAAKLHYNHYGLTQKPAAIPERKRAAAEKRKKARTAADEELEAAAMERGDVVVVQPLPLLPAATGAADGSGSAATLADAAAADDDVDAGVLNEEDIEELVEALTEAFAVDVAGAGGAVVSTNEQLVAALFDSWPGVDLSSDLLCPSDAATEPQQLAEGMLGSDRAAVFDLERMVASACGM